MWQEQRRASRCALCCFGKSQHLHLLAGRVSAQSLSESDSELRLLPEAEAGAPAMVGTDTRLGARAYANTNTTKYYVL